VVGLGGALEIYGIEGSLAGWLATPGAYFGKEKELGFFL